MRLGLNLGLLSPETTSDQLALAVEADRLGYDSCWVAEAYGADAVTALSYVAARTTSIDIGSAVLQIPARAATMTAMTAASLDAWSGGRFRLGLGVSGPQVSESWYGVPFAKPLARTKEYVETVRAALRREKVDLGGPKPLKLAMRPLRPDIPLYLAAVGPKNLALTGEIADGLLAIFVVPELFEETRRHLGETREGFDIVASVPVVIGDDVELCAEPVRAYTALYWGGMGSRTQNFYNAHAIRMGYADAAAEVQDHFLAGRYREAAEAVPFEFIDKTALIGPADRIRERMSAYEAAGVTTLSIVPMAGGAEQSLEIVRTMAELSTEDSHAAPKPTSTNEE